MNTKDEWEAAKNQLIHVCYRFWHNFRKPGFPEKVLSRLVGSSCRMDFTLGLLAENTSTARRPNTKSIGQLEPTKRDSTFSRIPDSLKWCQNL